MNKSYYKDKIFFFEKKEKRSLIKEIRNRLISVFSFEMNKNFLEDFVKRVDYLIGDIKNLDNKLDKSRISKSISDTAQKIESIADPFSAIWIIPSNELKHQDDKNLSSIGGISIKKTILIFIPPKWNIGQLKDIVAHESAHAIRSDKQLKNCLGEHIIAEGLAEYFSSIINKKISNRVYNIKKSERDCLLNKIKTELDSINKNLYSKLFFKNKKLGYSLGYSLVYNWMKFDKSKKSLKEALLTDYKTILSFNQKDGSNN